MNFNFNFDWNIISTLTTITAWLVLGFLIFRTYLQQDAEERPKLVKVFLVVLFGLFSFSINVPVFGELISLAILPLGVWLILAFTEKSGRWKVYRKYAWIGFFANYLFLAGTLTAIFISSVIYPEDELETYLHDVSKAVLVASHPSAADAELNLSQLEADIDSFELVSPDVESWYNNVLQPSLEDDAQVEEMFPFIMTNMVSKEGDDIHVFLEDDGRGILVTTSEQQLYFRSETASFLESEVDQE